MTLHVVCVAYHKPIALRGLVDSFMLQTNSDWRLHILHDGPAPASVLQTASLYAGDSHVAFECTPERYGNYGHPNRRRGLEQIVAPITDFVLITNDDNYYVPVFVEKMLAVCTPRVGMAYCNTVHSYMNYDVMYTRLKECYIDMGSFIVRLDVAQAVGFRHNHHSADGAYAVECAQYCMTQHLEVKYVDKPYFIHN